MLLRRINNDGTPIVDPNAEDNGGAGGMAGGVDSASDVFANGGAGNDASRVTYTPDGLLLDGQKLTSAVWTFEVTATGVYYVEKSDTGSIDFVAFDDPENVQPIVSNLTGVQSFRINGSDLYAVLINEDRVTWTVVYGDISVLGK